MKIGDYRRLIVDEDQMYLRELICRHVDATGINSLPVSSLGINMGWYVESRDYILEQYACCFFAWNSIAFSALEEKYFKRVSNILFKVATKQMRVLEAVAKIKVIRGYGFCTTQKIYRAFNKI